MQNAGHNDRLVELSLQISYRKKFTSENMKEGNKDLLQEFKKCHDAGKVEVITFCAT
ncbi:hypothetical protein OMAG_000240, partial [Candidatus Omnitrophus magneticus]